MINIIGKSYNWSFVFPSGQIGNEMIRLPCKQIGNK